MNLAWASTASGWRGYRPDRAVVDIGSNTVRLVVYAGSQRAPRTWLNESSSARLGRDLSATGRMPDKAMKQALGALARYALILSDLGVSDVQTVATAAVRDAANGGEFLNHVRALGVTPRLLTGEEEAQGSAFGVIGAFPGARGTVADLGGGSLELVQVEDGACHDGVSLPLGTLRLPALQAQGPDIFAAVIAKHMRKARASMSNTGPLYMVGGTWRAFAAFAIHAGNYPIKDPHGFTLDTVSAQRIARDVARMTPEQLAALPGISSSRAAVLPDAAAMLGVLLEELSPQELVFSSWGLREGLLFQRLTPKMKALDPLLAAADDFAEPRGGSVKMSRLLANWIAPALEGSRTASEPLALAATQLALAAAHIEANLRARQAYEWTMEKRWIGLDPLGRAWFAAVLQAASGKLDLPAELERLADSESLREAVGWGLAVRLARRLDPGVGKTLSACHLGRRVDHMILTVPQARAPSVTPKVLSDLKNLAKWCGLRAVYDPAA